MAGEEEIEATEDATTSDVDMDTDADAVEDTAKLVQIFHPIKVSSKTWVATSLTMVVRQRLIR